MSDTPARSADDVRRFVVTRSSVWDEEKQPCPEAYQDTYTRIDYRTFTNDRKAPAVEPRWFDEGENHCRSKGGGMQREFPGESAWFVDLPDLDALLAFIERHGNVVIGPFWRNRSLMEVEIYDSYRE